MSKSSTWFLFSPQRTFNCISLGFIFPKYVVLYKNIKIVLTSHSSMYLFVLANVPLTHQSLICLCLYILVQLQLRGRLDAYLASQESFRIKMPVLQTVWQQKEICEHKYTSSHNKSAPKEQYFLF